MPEGDRAVRLTPVSSAQICFTPERVWARADGARKCACRVFVHQEYNAARACLMPANLTFPGGGWWDENGRRRLLCSARALFARDPENRPPLGQDTARRAAACRDDQVGGRPSDAPGDSS